MDVILLEKIRNLGNLGEKVKVKPGYGRNFLIPEGKAIFATEENLAIFEARRSELEAHAKQAVAEAEKRAEKIKNLDITIPAKVSEEDKLFGSIGPREIADAITKAGAHVEKREVNLLQGIIRYVGEYDVEIMLHSDVNLNIQVKVVAAT